MDDSLREVQHALARLAAMGLSRVVVACVGPGSAEPASAIASTRLNSVISGAKSLRLPVDGVATTVNLVAGEAHFSPAYSWEQQTWDTEHELLCIVPHRDYLRVSLYQVSAQAEKRCVYVHTNRPHSPAFMHVLQALEALAMEAGRELPAGLVATYIDLAREALALPPGPEQDPQTRRCAEIRRYIENSFQEGLRRDDVARHFGLSAGYASQLFRGVYGQGIGGFILDCRMRLAENLLRATDLSVQQVAEQSGWGTTVHFVRAFRQRHGLPPGRWRNAAVTKRLRISR